MNKYKISLLLCVCMVFSFTFSACFGSDDDETVGEKLKRPLAQEPKSDFDDPAYENEQDGAEIVPTAHEEEDFIGKWKATSDYAEYMYGNVSLTINSDHTWKGNITDENFSGKWSAGNPGIFIRDTGGIIEWNLFFVADGNLVFKNLDDPDVTIVLKSEGK